MSGYLLLSVRRAGWDNKKVEFTPGKLLSEE